MINITQEEYDAIPDRNNLNGGHDRYRYTKNGQNYILIMKPCGGFNLELVNVQITGRNKE